MYYFHFLSQDSNGALTVTLKLSMVQDVTHGDAIVVKIIGCLEDTNFNDLIARYIVNVDAGCLIISASESESQSCELEL